MPSDCSNSPRRGAGSARPGSRDPSLASGNPSRAGPARADEGVTARSAWRVFLVVSTWWMRSLPILPV